MAHSKASQSVSLFLVNSEHTWERFLDFIRFLRRLHIDGLTWALALLEASQLRLVLQPSRDRHG
jgi:hypothetical protein